MGTQRRGSSIKDKRARNARQRKDIPELESFDRTQQRAQESSMENIIMEDLEEVGISPVRSQKRYSERFKVVALLVSTLAGAVTLSSQLVNLLSEAPESPLSTSTFKWILGAIIGISVSGLVLGSKGKGGE